MKKVSIFSLLIELTLTQAKPTKIGSLESNYIPLLDLKRIGSIKVHSKTNLSHVHQTAKVKA